MTIFTRIFLAGVLLVIGIASTAVAEEIPRFDVARFQVEGNTIIPAKDVEAILKPFIGKEKDFGDLQQALEALEDAYRSRGFHAVNVTLPEQELQGGTVVLLVKESKIRTVRIEGNKHFDEANIRASVPYLKEGSFPNINQISSSIRVANENPAKKMQLLLQESEQEGEINALLKVSDERPWKVGTYIEDTGTQQTGTLRLGFLAQYSNLFNLDHLLTLQYVTSPDHLKEVNIYSIGYRIPLYSLGDSIDLYAGYSDVDSGTVTSGVLSLAVSGKGTFGGFRYNQNLSRIGAYEHRLIYGWDYRIFENTINLGTIPLGSTTEAHPLTIGYSGNIAGNLGEAGFWTNLSQNIGGGDHGDTAAFRRVRVDASDDFTILRAGGNAVLLLPQDWQGRFTVSGQYTWDPLIPGEQFGIGGQGSVRGFGEREIADDMGVAGSVEAYTPNLLGLFGLPTSQLRGLAFYDVGYLARNKPQPGELKEQTIASTGLGARLIYDRYLSASTDYAFVTEPGGTRSRYSGRWHFRVQLAF